MPEFVRVRDNETGHEYSVAAARVAATPDLWTQVEKPAAHPNGDPLPPKYRTTVAKKASEKKAAKPANTEKENS